jgi:hypothetical protein
VVPSHVGQVTQDFVLVNGSKAFGAPDAAAFLKSVKLLEHHVTDSDGPKQFVSTAPAYWRIYWNRLAEEAMR